MKWLILLALLMILLAFIAMRFRQQIKMAVYVWRMFSKMRQVGKTGEKQIEKKAEPTDVALVRCAKCGSWIAQNTAINLRSGINYCSKACLETTATAN